METEFTSLALKMLKEKKNVCDLDFIKMSNMVNHPFNFIVDIILLLYIKLLKRILSLKGKPAILKYFSIT